jgi:hypothetical protein
MFTTMMPLEWSWWHGSEQECSGGASLSAAAWRRGLCGPSMGPAEPDGPVCVPAVVSGQHLQTTVEDVLQVVVLLSPSGSKLPTSSDSQVMRWYSLHRCEFADAVATGPEDGSGDGHLLGP